MAQQRHIDVPAMDVLRAHTARDLAQGSVSWGLQSTGFGAFDMGWGEAIAQRLTNNWQMSASYPLCLGDKLSQYRAATTTPPCHSRVR